MKRSSAPTPAPTRPRTGGRSARVVQDVLDAALEVFAERGYSGLSFEEVAGRAGVNKTTVYRRWPAKSDLVAAALSRMSDDDPEIPDTGSLREDLFLLLRQRVVQLSTPRRRGVARAILLDAEPELRELVATLRRERPAVPKSVIEAAIARGELPRGTDEKLLAEALVSPIHARVLWRGETVDDAFIVRLVELVLTGAGAGGAVVRSRRDRR
jgi:AcrR family transcriptional regulator